MKTEEILGCLSGIILFFIWLITLRGITFILFSQKYFVSGTEVIKVEILNQVFVWLIAGVLVFFVIFGHYFIYSSGVGGTEKTHDIKMMKSNLIGFFIWLLIVVIISLFQINISNLANITGGYLTILIIYILIKWL